MVINVSELNQDKFQETITSNELCLIDVWAAWCGPCKQLSPIIDEVSSEVMGKCLVCKMDADKNLDLCKDLNIRNIPTILLYKKGELVERLSGLKSKKEIVELIEKNY